MAGMFPFRISPEAHEHFGNLAQRMGDWRLRDKELKEEKKRLEMTLQSQQDINKRTLYMDMQGRFMDALYRALLDENAAAAEALCDMAVEKGMPPDEVRATRKRVEGMADRSRQTTPFPTPVPVEGAPVSVEGAPATPEDEASRQRRELTKRLGLPYVTSPEEGSGLRYLDRPPTEGIREQRRAREERVFEQQKELAEKKAVGAETGEKYAYAAETAVLKEIGRLQKIVSSPKDLMETDAEYNNRVLSAKRLLEREEYPRYANLLNEKERKGIGLTPRERETRDRYYQKPLQPKTPPPTKGTSGTSRVPD